MTPDDDPPGTQPAAQPSPSAAPSPSEGLAPETSGASGPAAQSAAPSAAGGPPNKEAGALGEKPISDANDLRGYHFRRLIRRPATWIATVLAMIACGLAVAILIGAALGAGAALVVFLLCLAIVFAIADARSADSFFDIYARQRGLQLGGRGSLPEATPLLRKGTDRYAERTLSGPMAAGIDGTLALYTYETESSDSDGNRQKQYHRFTLGLIEVPECERFVPELFCQQKFGPHALERFEDAFRRSKERVKLESEALDERYEIFSGKGQDATWLRQLFSPTFIVWLTDEAPRKFAFELVDGTLCCYIHGHKQDVADLDSVAGASSTVGARLRAESTE